MDRNEARRREMMAMGQTDFEELETKGGIKMMMYS